MKTVWHNFRFYMIDREGAQHLVDAFIPHPTVQEMKEALTKAVYDMLSHGLTEAVTDDLSFYGDYRTLLQAFKSVINEKRKFRAHVFRRSTVFEQLMEDGATYLEPWVEPGEVKFSLMGRLARRQRC